jgi:hypothetical protein
MNKLFQYICKYCGEVVTIGYDDWFHNYEHCKETIDGTEQTQGRQ